jgi:hypothetical protein
MPWPTTTTTHCVPLPRLVLPMAAPPPFGGSKMPSLKHSPTSGGLEHQAGAETDARLAARAHPLTTGAAVSNSCSAKGGMRQVSPAGTGFENPENAFENTPLVGPWPSGATTFGQKRRDAPPLIIIEKGLRHSQLFTTSLKSYRNQSACFKEIIKTI